MEKLTFEFDNPEALNQFALWLCGAGEQDYWNWMECREQEQTGNITATNFNYHNEDESLPQNDPKRYGPFLNDNVIRTTCGRMDDRKEK
jgi:hypothetical protein